MSVVNYISIRIAAQAANTYSTIFQHITKYFIKKLLTLLTTDIYMVFLSASKVKGYWQKFINEILYRFQLHSSTTISHWLPIYSNQFHSQTRWQKDTKYQLSIVSVENASINGVKCRQIRIQIWISIWVRQNKY